MVSTLHQLENALPGVRLRRLVAGLELHLFLGPDISDGLEGEVGRHNAVIAELPHG
jgi:hypothetical protein